MREAVLVGNMSSRHGKRLFVAARTLLEQRGLSVAASHPVADHRELRRVVKAAAAARAPLVVVAGGDGSQTIAAGALAHAETVLGVIPAGTGNSFAQTLGIGTHLESAIDAIVNGTVVEVDLGIVNGTYFANFTTLGLSSEIAGDTPRWLKNAFGVVAYGVEALVPLLYHRALQCNVKYAKNRLNFMTHQIIVANGRYYGDKPLLPQASIVDGCLTFFATRSASRFEALKTYVALARGTQQRLNDAEFFEAPSMTIQADRKMPVAIDGNLLEKTKCARFEIARKALRVMVPAGFNGQS